MHLKYYLKTRLLPKLRQYPFLARLERILKSSQQARFIQNNSSDVRFEAALWYHEMFLRHGNKKFEDADCFEFGAGRELFITICLGAIGKTGTGIKEDKGTGRIHTLDLFKLIEPDWLTVAAKKAKDKIGYPDAIPHFAWANMEQILSDVYGIDYHAPADARSTGLPDESIDYVFNNAVMEHIPQDVLVDILKECRRIMRPDAVFACDIGYWDHAVDGKSISPYHFLRFSDEEWTKYSPAEGCHNRMRHKDFHDLFEKSGFAILASEPYTPFDPEFKPTPTSRITGSSEQYIQSLKSMPLAAEFKKYSLEELAVLGGKWILKKK